MDPTEGRGGVEGLDGGGQGDALGLSQQVGHVRVEPGHVHAATCGADLACVTGENSEERGPERRPATQPQDDCRRLGVGHLR